MLKFVYRTQRNQYVYYCNKPSSKSSSYSHTVLLPKTKLPLRIEGQKLVESDKNVYKLGSFESLYEWQKSHLEEPEYVIHDGPPYANGKPHMGHAINKGQTSLVPPWSFDFQILKDTILRYKILDRKKVNYIPGWDCHGLPIELKALSDIKNLDAVQIRSKARNFADKTIKQQMETFKSWGLIGDWQNHYETKTVDYVQNQFRQFLQLYELGYVYRDMKPIYWSPSSRTALAEAELEYNDSHKSPSVYVRLKIKDIPQVRNLKEKRVYAVIWTTTPWTLPSNQAVCYNNALSYCIIKKSDLDDRDLYIIATDLFENYCRETNCEYQLLGVHTGDMLSGATYVHPIYKEQSCAFLHSSHATNAKGTGLVHTAPAHGPDDFLVAIKNKMTITDLVSDEGHYKSEAGEFLANKFVLTEGNEIILSRLQEDLLHRGEIQHSYPYDWRTKQPVIIKASKQWFIDTDKIKDRALAFLEKVKIIPEDKSEIYKRSLVTQLQNRPYWCISRQRKWGVPIPVFYHRDSGEPQVNQKIIDHICAQLLKHGTDFWWTLPIEQLLPADYGQNMQDYVKGEDILDIWFDSGISWSYALKENQIADLYLEGVDQFTGWFQSSLITSAALKNQAPYKAIFVHGFAVDKNGVKMSKSLGNVVDPVDVTCGGKGQRAYGVDTLRWWVACHANQVSLASVSGNILNQSKEEIQKIRSVLRFAIGALFDYQYEETDFQNTRLADKYVLHLLYQFSNKAKYHIDLYNFHKINSSLIAFLTNQISAQYFTSIKDRLYCEPANSESRRSAQYTLLHLYYTVSSIVAGILPHLVEECYAYLPQRMGETFFTSERLKPNVEWENIDVEGVAELILDVRKEVNRICDDGSALNTDCIVEFTRNHFELLESYMKKDSHFQDDLKDILQVSNIEIRQSNLEDRSFRITTSKSSNFGCPRCRLVQSKLEGELCPRCRRVVDVLDVNKKAVVG